MAQSVRPQKPVAHPQSSSTFHSWILFDPKHLCADKLTTSIMSIIKAVHEYVLSNRNINSQAQESHNNTNIGTNLLCFLIVFLESKSLLFNFFKGGATLLLFRHKLFFFIPCIFNPLCQLLNHFLICFNLNLTTVDLSAVFINILRNGMDKKELLVH